MRFSLSVLLLALTISSKAWGLEKEPFSEARFQELQSDGKLVLVDVFADWCKTCAAQQLVLGKYRAAHPDIELHILEVDFDKDREQVRKLRAPRQSTLLLFRGGASTNSGTAWRRHAKTSSSMPSTGPPHSSPSR